MTDQSSRSNSHEQTTENDLHAQTDAVRTPPPRLTTSEPAITSLQELSAPSPLWTLVDWIASLKPSGASCQTIEANSVQDPKSDDTHVATAERRQSTGLTRRGVLGTLGAGTVASVGLALTDGNHSLAAADSTSSPSVPAPESTNRLEAAFDIRQTVADRVLDTPIPDHQTNGDEERYDNKIASYSKGLPHNDLGEVDLDAYQELLTALESGNGEDFEAITRGGELEFIEPQAAFGFTLAGTDPYVPEVLGPARFDSPETASEMAELYWMALARDVPFQEYDNAALTQAAAEDLTAFSAFAGPMTDGEVTPQTLFRDFPSGATTGPYVSQFLLQPIPEGALTKDQQIRTAAPGVDYLTAYDDWLAAINGQLDDVEETAPDDGVQVFDPQPRYVRTGRDLAECFHRDVRVMPYVNAFLFLQDIGARIDGLLPDPSIVYDEGNPYTEYEAQDEFVNFGRFGALDLIASVAHSAKTAVWFQKWRVHRRLRPEEFGGRIENHLTEQATYPINQELFDSPVLERSNDEFGSYLLAQAYPEGAPAHPAYPGGHAVAAGACVTALKAVVDESQVIEDPVQATADGLALEPCSLDEELTVGTELDKLASNVTMARAFGGVHYRSNSMDGLTLGEEMAIGWLEDAKLRYNEFPDEFEEWTLTTFAGETVTI